MVSFTHRPLYPRGKSPDMRCLGGWAGPRNDLDHMERRTKLPLPALELRPSITTVLSLLPLRRLRDMKNLKERI
jgi:hypothetical protein